jgi:hypothetical protein
MGCRRVGCLVRGQSGLRGRWLHSATALCYCLAASERGSSCGGKA